ncbi:MAG: hypothetical protein R3Y51_00025 [Rikenellaceae bacterium]
MKRYTIRAIKYFIFLTVLYLLIFVVMSSTGAIVISFASLREMLMTQSGLLMLGLVVVLSAVHPLIGYTTREITADTTGKETAIKDIMNLLGFKAISTNGDITIFKAKGIFKRLGMQFEDKLEYNAANKTLTGNRKQVTIAVYRIQSHLINQAKEN